MTTVLVAAAYPTVRAGLAAVLRDVTGIDVVGEAAGAGQLLALAATLEPDVVLAEIEAAGEEMVEAAWQLAGQTAGPGIVLLCDATEPWVRDALLAGIRGILARDAGSPEIAAAVQAAAHGLVVAGAATLSRLLSMGIPAQSALAPPALAEPLTPREVEVLHLLSEGLGNKMISRRLSISEHTVKFHVGSIMAKLGAGSRTEAVTAAARRGLIML